MCNWTWLNMFIQIERNFISKVLFLCWYFFHETNNIQIDLIVNYFLPWKKIPRGFKDHAEKKTLNHFYLNYVNSYKFPVRNVIVCPVGSSSITFFLEKCEYLFVLILFSLPICDKENNWVSFMATINPVLHDNL